MNFKLFQNSSHFVSLLDAGEILFTVGEQFEVKNLKRVELGKDDRKSKKRKSQD